MKELAKDIMSRQFHTLNEEMSISEAVKIFKSAGAEEGRKLGVDSGSGEGGAGGFQILRAALLRDDKAAAQRRGHKGQRARDDVTKDMRPKDPA